MHGTDAREAARRRDRHAGLPVHRHRREHPALGGPAGRDGRRPGPPRRDPPRRDRIGRRHRRQDDRRRDDGGLRDGGRGRRGEPRGPARPDRHRVGRDRPAPRPDGAQRGRRRAARRRLLRPDDQPHRPAHGRRSRRPGPAVGGGRRALRRTPPGGREPARPRRVPAQGPRPPGARVPAGPSGPRVDVPAADDLRQRRASLPIPTYGVRRPAGRARSGRAPPRGPGDPPADADRPGRHGQDEPRHPGRRATRWTRFRDGVSFVDLSAARDADGAARRARSRGRGGGGARPLDPRASWPTACASGRSCWCSTTSSR